MAKESKAIQTAHRWHTEMFIMVPFPLFYKLIKPAKSNEQPTTLNKATLSVTRGSSGG